MQGKLNQSDSGVHLSRHCPSFRCLMRGIHVRFDNSDKQQLLVVLCWAATQ